MTIYISEKLPKTPNANPNTPLETLPKIPGMHLQHTINFKRAHQLNLRKALRIVIPDLFCPENGDCKEREKDEEEERIVWGNIDPACIYAQAEATDTNSYADAEWTLMEHECLRRHEALALGRADEETEGTGDEGSEGTDSEGDLGCGGLFSVLDEDRPLGQHSGDDPSGRGAMSEHQGECRGDNEHWVACDFGDVFAVEECPEGLCALSADAMSAGCIPAPPAMDDY
jgi:hypothetical protein